MDVNVLPSINKGSFLSFPFLSFVSNLGDHSSASKNGTGFTSCVRKLRHTYFI